MNQLHTTTRPTPLDWLVQRAYVVAFWLLRIRWFFTRPRTYGALCAVWYEGRVLLVGCAYRRSLSLPGGFRDVDEAGRDAASRELREEVGISVPAERLSFYEHYREKRQYREEDTEIYEVIVTGPVPKPRIDHREITSAVFLTPEQALAGELIPPVRRYLLARSALTKP